MALDGKPLALEELVPALDAVVGPFGFGRIDMIENRRSGSRAARSTSALALWPFCWRTLTSKR